MTSKEALKRLYYDAIGSIIDEEIDRKYLEEMEKDYKLVNSYLTKLEEINNVWHKNEPLECVDINGNHLQEVYDFIKRLIEENDKLKKVIEILKRFVATSYCRNEETNKYDIPVMYSLGSIQKITQEEYELLKGVL